MTGTILIVEDEEDIAKLVAINLEAEGYECRVASRGDDAVTMAVAVRPDLVVLDLMLPGLDGVEVCRQLRKDPRTAATGIIMLTARSLPSDRVAGLEAHGHHSRDARGPRRRSVDDAGHARSALGHRLIGVGMSGRRKSQDQGNGHDQAHRNSPGAARRQ